MISLFYHLYQRATFAEVDEVIFFNKCQNTICEDWLNGYECINENCVHNKIKKIVSYIHKAKKTIDMSIYTVSQPTLINALIKAKKRGVHVRFITDRTVGFETSAVARFLANGIEVRTKKSAYLMHNKFFCIDTFSSEGVIITGSMNWTKQSFQENYENVNIMSKKAIRDEFQNYFDSLWEVFSRSGE